MGDSFCLCFFLCLCVCVYVRVGRQTSLLVEWAFVTPYYDARGSVMRVMEYPTGSYTLLYSFKLRKQNTDQSD